MDDSVQRVISLARQINEKLANVDFPMPRHELAFIEEELWSAEDKLRAVSRKLTSLLIQGRR